MNTIHPIQPTLDSLFRHHFHGAANIRGIHYQLKYSLLCALDLCIKNGIESIQYEGIEDLDLQGFLCDDVYIQVKYRSRKMSWSEFAEIIAGYLETFRAESVSQFLLVTNQTPSTNIEKFFLINALPEDEKSQVIKRVINLCRNIGATQEEVEQLSSHMSIELISSDDLRSRLNRKCTEVFDAGSCVDSILFALLGKSLEWAEQRQEIRRADVEAVSETFAEDQARYKDYEAFGRHLIDRIAWDNDNRPEDFYEGKATRPGHIAMALDIRREKWLDRIGQVFTKNGICAIRSSSGQGKSALVLRYAFELWNSDFTFILNACESAEDAVKVVNYFRHRNKVGLPSYLMIEDAGLHVSHWTEVAKGCVALGVNVLIGVRNEDWYRFAELSDTTIEVVTPMLDINEAKDIFLGLERVDKIHNSVISADWAFERLGEPQLLMEYVYLLTHGEMLRDRLASQIRAMQRPNEDSNKVEFLRRIAAGQAAGVPLKLNKLREAIHFDQDPQQTVLSLKDEYINISGDYVSGLHWVRSNHLFELLHDTDQSKEETLINIYPAVPTEVRESFVANSLRLLNAGSKDFIEHIAELIDPNDLEEAAAVLSGAFRGGEALFIRHNQAMFDQIGQERGISGIRLLGIEITPSIGANPISRLEDLGDEFKEKVEIFREALEGINLVDRGVDFVRGLLEIFVPNIKRETLEQPTAILGALLDWCSFSGIKLSRWSGIRYNEEVLSFRFLDLRLLLHGCARYDPKGYRRWVKKVRSRLYGYLMLKLEVTTLESSRTDLKIEFIADGSEDLNDQAVRRLESLRMILPFYKRYCSQGIYARPDGLELSIDPTYKDIPIDNLPARFDVDKNRVFLDELEAVYGSNSYYEFQAAWMRLRNVALKLIELFSKYLVGMLESKKVSRSLSESISTHSRKLINDLQWVPMPPMQTSQDIKEKFKEKSANGWATSIENFIRLLSVFLLEKREDARKLALHNLRESEIRLEDVWNAFDAMFSSTPDYHNEKALRTKESKAYASLTSLFDCWHSFPPQGKITNIRRYIRQHHKKAWDVSYEKLIRVQKASAEQNIQIKIPSDRFYEHPLTHLGFVIEIPAPDFAEASTLIRSVAGALSGLGDLADYFWFIPVFDETRWVEGAFRIGSDHLQALFDGPFDKWELMIPLEIPNGVLDTLPDYPLKKNQAHELSLRNEGLKANLAYLIEMSKHIAPLKKAKDPYRQQLYKKLTSKLKQVVEESKQLAGELRNALSDISESMHDGSALGLFDDRLAAIQNAENVETLIKLNYDIEVSIHMEPD